VEFIPDQSSEPGKTVTIRVLLNGEAVTYPVDVNYDIYTGSTALGSGIVSITGGIEAAFDYDLPGNIVSGDISFSVTAVANAGTGPGDTHRVSIINGNVEPLPSLEITQNGVLTSIVTSDGGLVSVRAMVRDSNSMDTHTYDWSGTDNLLLASNPGLLDAQFIIDPTSVLPGFYKVEVMVADDGLPSLDATVEIYLQFLNTAPVLTNQDSDGDGIADNIEGFGDGDGDGIPDYLDGLDNAAMMQTTTGVFDRWLMNTQPGLGLRLGKISLATNHHVAGVSADEIWQMAGSLGGVVPADATDSYTNAGGYFDFEIHGLNQPGQSVLVVIPQFVIIPENAVYRKYTEAFGWNSYVEDSRNGLSSAPGEPGVCPAPGDPAFVPGLNQGHFCVQLLVEDGGPNDADARRNGVIEDPGGVATLTATQTVTSSSSGGGSMGGVILLLLLLRLDRLNAGIRRIYTIRL